MLKCRPRDSRSTWRPRGPARDDGRAVLVGPPSTRGRWSRGSSYVVLLLGGVFVLRLRVFVDAVVRGPRARGASPSRSTTARTRAGLRGSSRFSRRKARGDLLRRRPQGRRAPGGGEGDRRGRARRGAALLRARPAVVAAGRATGASRPGAGASRARTRHRAASPALSPPDRPHEPHHRPRRRRARPDGRGLDGRGRDGVGSARRPRRRHPRAA